MFPKERGCLPGFALYGTCRPGQLRQARTNPLCLRGRAAELVSGLQGTSSTKDRAAAEPLTGDLSGSALSHLSRRSEPPTRLARHYGGGSQMGPPFRPGSCRPRAVAIFRAGLFVHGVWESSCGGPGASRKFRAQLKLSARVERRHEPPRALTTRNVPQRRPCKQPGCAYKHSAPGCCAFVREIFFANAACGGTLILRRSY